MNPRSTSSPEKGIDLPGARIDFERGEVQFADGGRCALSQRESQLLGYLAANPGRVISRDEILSQVWKLNSQRIVTRVIDMHVVHLRDKMRNSRALQTVYGQGYVFEPSAL